MAEREPPLAPAECIVACHECDTLQRLTPLPPGARARCARCGARLYAHPWGGLDTPLALTVGALFLYLIANGFPLLELEIQGRSQSTTLTGAALALARSDMATLGLVVWATSVLAPGLVIGMTLYVLLAVRLRLDLPQARRLLAWLTLVRPWGMLDVFMLGVLVAMVKLSDMAQLVVGPGLYAYGPLLLFTAGAAATLEPRFLWERMGPSR
jgi:paraquat-inducible protein A